MQFPSSEWFKDSGCMEYIFVLSLFIVAFLYSSVGHGGASGYLAIMALFGIAPVFMRSTALSLNVFVSAIAFVTFTRAGYFRSRLIIPFLITSLPMAFVGALVKVRPDVYEILLGIFLLMAVARMLFIPGAIAEHPSRPPIIIALLIGATLGFFSGMIGIGGGIILSPILILFHWARVKESAAASALFIFLNSLAGLFALVQSGLNMEPRLILWIGAGVLGGISGSYLGSSRLKPVRLKYLLSAILLMASIKLLML
jgi:uncharacterized protein